MKKQLLVLLMLGAFVGRVQAFQVDYNGKIYEVSELQEKLFNRLAKDPETPKETWDALLEIKEEKEEKTFGKVAWSPPARIDQKDQVSIGKLKQIAEQKRMEAAARLVREKAEKERIQKEREEAAAAKRERERLAEEQRVADERERVRVAAEQQAERERLAEEARIVAEALRKEEARLAAQQAELERIERERIVHEEAVRAAEIERALVVEKKRLADLQRAEEEQNQKIMRLEKQQAEDAAAALKIEEGVRIAEQMRQYAEEEGRKRTAEEQRVAEREATQRVLDAIAAEDSFKGLHMTCARCPQSGLQQCPNFKSDKFGRLSMRFDGDGYTSGDVKYPLNFKKTFQLWKARILNDLEPREASDREFSPLFRALYDCARGIYEDIEATQNGHDRQFQENKRYAKHYPGVEAPKLESWSEKYPVLLEELKKIGFTLANLVDGYSYGYSYGYSSPSITSIGSTVAKYFILNGTDYEKGIFSIPGANPNDSNLYLYMQFLTQENLRNTPAGREALALVAAQEQEQQAQTALAQPEASAAAAAADEQEAQELAREAAEGEAAERAQILADAQEALRIEAAEGEAAEMAQILADAQEALAAAAADGDED